MFRFTKQQISHIRTAWKYADKRVENWYHWILTLRWIPFPPTCFFNVCFTQCCKTKPYDISLKKFLNFVNFNLLNDKRILFFCLVGKAVAVSVGLENSSGWKWVNGQPLAIGHLNVTNMINNYDGYKDPCDSNYCGIFSVGSSKNLKIYDNCCNNIVPYFVCSIPFKHWEQHCCYISLNHRRYLL